MADPRMGRWSATAFSLACLCLPAFPLSKPVIRGVFVGIGQRWIVVYLHDELVNRMPAGERVGTDMHQLRRQLADVMDAEQGLIRRPEK
jgi:hypothetical protein